MSYPGFLSLHIPNILITLYTKLEGEEKESHIIGIFPRRFSPDLSLLCMCGILSVLFLLASPGLYFTDELRNSRMNVTWDLECTWGTVALKSTSESL